MKKIVKKGFTLVELIVVITILTILGTIGFISIQNYTVYSRDVVRITDINNMKSVLEYTYIENSRYPIPDDGEEITYDGGEVWTQGNFGRKTRRATKRLDKIPLDPLTQDTYTYSVLNTGSEYELGAIFEGEEVAIRNNIIDNSYADTSNLKAYISGNYNGQIAKVSTGGLDYVLAVPSIINTDISETKLIDIITNNKLAINGYKNLPSSYNINSSPILPENIEFVKSENLIVYSGSFETLKTNEEERINLISNLQKAYSGTIIQNESQIKNIVSIEIDISNPSPKAKNLVANLVNAKIITKESEKIALVADNYNLGTIEFQNWKSIDTNCDIDDITIGTQIWAGCNSTLGNGDIYDSGNCVSKGGTNCYGYITKEVDYDSDNGINNIWGKLYSFDDSSSACTSGRHVPSDEEWTILENYLNGSICRTNGGDGWKCNGLGWKNYKTKTNSNNLIKALLIPRSGYKDYGTFNNRAHEAYFWTSTKNGDTSGLMRRFHTYEDTILSYVSSINRYKYSVRCIKD